MSNVYNYFSEAGEWTPEGYEPDYDLAYDLYEMKKGTTEDMEAKDLAINILIHILRGKNLLKSCELYTKLRALTTGKGGGSDLLKYWYNKEVKNFLSLSETKEFGRGFLQFIKSLELHSVPTEERQGLLKLLEVEQGHDL